MNRKIRKKRIIYTLILVMLFSMLSFSGAQASGTWKVATHSGQEPFVYYNEERVLTGIDIDVATLLAEEAEKEIEFVDADPEDFIQLLADREVDFVIAAIEATEELQELADITDYYYNVTLLEALMDEQQEEIQYVIVLQKGRTLLQQSLNEGIATLKESGELTKIIEKYIITEEAET